MPNILTEDDYETLENDFESPITNLLSEMDLEELKKESYMDNTMKGVLFSICFNLLKNHVNYLPEKQRKKVSDFIHNFKGISELNKSVEIYKSESYGKNHESENIRSYVRENEENIDILINDLFFKIFGE